MTEAKKKPWMKWYPSDWRGEPTLRLVSRAARSVWVDLLGLMHESTLIGTLFVNGRIPTLQDLAKVLGDDPKTLAELLNELRDAGVYSVDEDGAIYSRKMRRAAEISEKGRKDIQKRGGAWAPGKKPAAPKRKSNSDPNRGAIRDPMPQRLETREEKKEVATRELEVGIKVPQPVPVKSEPTADIVPLRAQSPATKREAITQRLIEALGTTAEMLHRRGGFESFPWVFAEWVAQGCDAEADIWPTISKLAARANELGRRVVTPTYFEKAIFRARDDRIAALPTPAERRQGFDDAMLAWTKADRWWHESLGPRPDEPGCLVPLDILQKYMPEKFGAAS